MLKASSAFMTIMAVIAIASTAGANVWRVPERFAQIQLAIDFDSVVNGDTVSVWGPEGVPPPYIYYENVVCQYKSLFIVNRSFLPTGGTGYDSSWDHVVIDGRQLGEVVVMTNAAHPVLKGFTIQNGFNYAGGGGVRCDPGSVIKNHIHHNIAGSGGGIKCFLPSGAVYIYDNLIEDNSCLGFSSCYGGGIHVYSSTKEVHIQRNVIRRNETGGQLGGGVYMRYVGDDPEFFPTDWVQFSDNVIVDNYAAGGGLDPYGGGIFAHFPIFARRNVITNNYPDGVCAAGSADFGIPVWPGLNVIMNNVMCDMSYGTKAVGNYWGYLDTHTILERILDVGVDYDPVAASSRWFDVDLEPGSYCETDVLVTGDLRVSRPLTIQPGRKFEFSPDPDTSLAGGDPGKTDFILAGSSLQAIGTSEDSIIFTSWPNAVWPGESGDWYGIRLGAWSTANLKFCDVNSAYCGVEVTGGAFAEIESSQLHACQFAGVYNLGGQVEVVSSDVKNNGVYGVKCEFPGLVGPPEPSRIDSNRLSDNGQAGVSFTGSQPPDDVPHHVFHNQVVAGNVVPSPPPYGIEIRVGGDCIGVDSNDVSGFHQAGIAACEASSPLIVGNTVLSNTVTGIACFEWSNPYVRWNTVNLSQNGVFCDPTSLPDLGTEADSGNNSILFDNVVWVHQVALMAESVMARLNWWGVDNADEFPAKFVGNIVYEPWLLSPPGDGDGGQQSAGSNSSLLETGLGRPLPMPMSGTARIPFQIAQAGPVSLNVVDASGRVVRALVRGERAPGRYNVTWDRSDNSGRLMPEGVYFLRFEAGARRDVQKLVVMH